MIPNGDAEEETQEFRGGALAQVVLYTQKMRCHHAGSAMPVSEIVQLMGSRHRVQSEQQQAIDGS